MSAKKCLLMTRQVKIPLLLLQASEDRIVSNLHQIKFIKKLAKTNQECALKIVYGARHELLFETDEHRNQTLDTIINFFHNSQSSK